MSLITDEMINYANFDVKKCGNLHTLKESKRMKIGCFRIVVQVIEKSLPGFINFCVEIGSLGNVAFFF